MNYSEIEYWALNILDRCKKRQPIEDSRVELKANWIEVEKAARILAGHANAARGESILWLVGVDDKNGIVVGADKQEFSNWFLSVKSQFDGLAPEVSSINIPYDGGTVVALLFETDRAPFVVKNPLHGKTKGEPAALEVPWREGTGTRSATRSDLLKLLVPLQKLPKVEILDGNLVVISKESVLVWYLNFELYVIPKEDMPVVIPFHHCKIEFEVDTFVEKTEMSQIKLYPPYSIKPEGHLTIENRSLTINATTTEVLIGGPGALKLSANGRTSSKTESPVSNARIFGRFQPTEAEIPILIEVILHLSDHQNNEFCRWNFRK